MKTDRDSHLVQYDDIKDTVFAIYLKQTLKENRKPKKTEQVVLDVYV
jgi:hypothetical protein